MSYSVCKPALFLKYLVRFVACHASPPHPFPSHPSPAFPSPPPSIFHCPVPHTCHAHTTHMYSYTLTYTHTHTHTHPHSQHTHPHPSPPPPPSPTTTHSTAHMHPTNQASVTDATLKIPHRLHNTIIGPKGKLLRSVMSECGGVRIHFPPSDSKSDEVRLHGPRDDVEKAKALLKDLADSQVLPS